MGVKGGGKDVWIEENGLCLEGSHRQTKMAVMLMKK